jgi:hypothetical protein
MKKQMYLVMLACFSLLAQAQTVIPAYVPTNSLVGWWPFNGNANDLSINANNGTVNGATLTADRFGNTNKAYNFNVSNWSFGTGGDYIYIPYNPIFNFTNFTISSWVKRASAGSSISPQPLSIIRRFQYGYNNPNGETWALDIGHGTSANGSVLYGTVIQQSPSPALNFYCQSTQSISLNQWSFITMTYSQNTIKLYINNQLICSTSNPSITINTAGNSGISIGLSDQANGKWVPFDGAIDDIGIWSRALTECEIKKLYYAPSFTASASSATICAGQSLTLSAGGVPNYAWSSGANTASTIVTPSASVVYTVTSTYTAGCTDTKTVSVTVNACTGINENQLSQEISIYPNPTKENITIVSNSNIIGKTYSITDQLGKLISNGKLTSEDMKISLNGLSTGLYFLKIENQIFKIVKE